MSPTLSQLRHAFLVAECCSFSEAARRCNASQPTVSTSVSELEAALGKPLFARSTRRVELTAFGRALLPRIEEALLAADRIQHEAEALLNPDRKLLRIAFTPLIHIRRIDALCAAYRQAHPDVEIIFKECDASDMEGRLDSEQVDVICGPGISGNSRRARCLLFEDPLHYIPPMAEVAGLPKNVSLDVAARGTLLLSVGLCGLAPATQALFENAGLRIRTYAGRANSHAALQEWAELGLGAAILPASRIEGEAAKFPRLMSGNRQEYLAYDAVWLKSSTATPHLKPFFQMLPRIARSVGKQSAEWR